MDPSDEINQPIDPQPPEPVTAPEPIYAAVVSPAPIVPFSPFYEPTQDERTFATLAHAL